MSGCGPAGPSAASSGRRAELSNGPTRKWPSDRRMMMCGASGQSPYRPDADKAATGGEGTWRPVISRHPHQRHHQHPITPGRAIDRRTSLCRPICAAISFTDPIKANGVTGRAFRQPQMPTGATSGSSPSAARCRDSGRRVDGRRHRRQEIGAHLIAQRRYLARDVFLLQRTHKLQELGCTCSKTPADDSQDMT